VDAAAESCGCCAAAVSSRLDDVACVGTDAVTRGNCERHVGGACVYRTGMPARLTH
jgi:hypothetical protein